MKILQVCPDFPPWAMGGAPRAFRQLAESWRRRGHEVTVACSLPASRSREPSLEADYRIEPYALRDLPPALHEARYYAPMLPGDVRRFSRFVEEAASSYDVIVVHGLLETISREFLRHYPQAEMRKLVNVQYGIPGADHNRLLRLASWSLYTWLGKLLISQLENIVVFSSASGSELHTYFGPLKGKRIQQLILGIDPAPFGEDYASVTQQPLEAARWLESRSIHRPFIFAIGRNDRAKGFDILLDSFRQLTIQFPKLTLVLAGDRTPFTDVLERMVRAYGLQSKVSMLGSVSSWESMVLLVTSELFVIPSRKEGYGLNAVMARILSKPTIATSTGAHDEILGRCPGSHVVKPGDASQLAEALRTALLGTRTPVSLDPDQLAIFDIRSLADELLRLTPSDTQPRG